MSVATTPTVDVGALAGEIRLDVSNRLAEMLEVGFDACDGEAYPLSSLQKAQLTSSAFDCFDGFERAVAKDIIEALAGKGIEAWGLSSSLADLLPGESDA